MNTLDSNEHIDDWEKENKTILNSLSRKELVKFTWRSALESINGKRSLFFGEREIVGYQLINMLVLENETDFQFEKEDRQTLFAPDSLQEDLNATNIINIIDWVLCNSEKHCVIELSNNDVIDFSELSGQEGSGTKCIRSLLAIVKQEGRFIYVQEIIESGS